jgi:hypothetical protein
MDHGFGTGVQGFIIAGQTAVEHEPAETSFHYPAAFQDVESAGLGISRDDFHVDAYSGPVLDGGVLESGVGPGL